MLSDVELKNVHAVVDFIQEQGVMRDQTSFLTDIVVDFAEIFQHQNGIQAMVNFIKWAKDRHAPIDEVMVTIGHDLNGRKERLFDPRTSSYLDREI